MTKSFISTILLVVLFCGSARPQEISYGDSVSLQSDILKTWMKTDSSNNPQSIGFTFSEEDLKNLPSQVTVTNSLDFPKNASDTLFSHMQAIWLPNGHNLHGHIYEKPHLTDHIFIISKQEREAITSTIDTFQVDPQFVPPGYEQSGPNIQYAGTHWFDTTGSEYHGEAFTKALIYGYSKGKISFYEIAASKAYLETHPHFTGNIKQPEKFHRKGYYPTAYKIDYDSVNHVFNYELADFVLRQAAITGIEDSRNKNIPDKFALYQNYPNPFNPATSIDFSLPKTGFTQLKVYNILGKEVATIVSQRLERGSYTFSFTAENLASGLYYYRLQSGEFNKVKKMLLVK